MQHFQSVLNKIVDQNQLKALVSEWHNTKRKIVFTNGCFDLLHLGHIDYLSKAADFGDVLVIGLNSDQSVRNIKGKNRPIQDEYSRARIMAALSFVTAVTIFETDTPYDLICSVKPDILVKGADYKIEEIAGADVVIANGGEVKLIEYLPGYSTSAIEKKIKSGL